MASYHRPSRLLLPALLLLFACDDPAGPGKNDPVDPGPESSVRVVTGRILGVVTGSSAARGQSQDDQQRVEIPVPADFSCDEVLQVSTSMTVESASASSTAIAALTVTSRVDPGSLLRSMDIDFSGASMAAFTGDFGGASAGYDALVEFSFVVEGEPVKVQFDARSLVQSVFRVTPESSSANLISHLGPASALLEPGTYVFHGGLDQGGISTFGEETLEATSRLEGTLSFSEGGEGAGG